MLVVVEGFMKIVYCIMEFLGNGRWRGSFVFWEVGEYKVCIEVGNILLFGSFFMIKVGDLIKCSVVGNGELVVNFILDK